MNDKIVPLSDFNNMGAEPKTIEAAADYDAGKAVIGFIEDCPEKITSMLAIGFDKEGRFIMLTSDMRLNEALWIIKRAEREVMA